MRTDLTRMEILRNEMREDDFSKNDIDEMNCAIAEITRLREIVDKLQARSHVFDFIDTERMKQDKKWGEQNHGKLYWLGILSEEVGEMSKAIIEGNESEYWDELIQVASVAVAMMECELRRVAEAAKKEGE